jgi:hypothetical protein
MSRRALGPAAILVLLLVAAAHGQSVVKRINCGGGAVTLATGEVFESEHPYGPATPSGYVGGESVLVASEHDGMYVGGYEDPHSRLHYNGREGWQAYRLELLSGDYVVRLHLAELNLHDPQLRVFDVSLEGSPVLTGLDLAARFGIQYGAVFAAPVTVSDGRLDIEAGGADPSILSALEVFRLPAIGRMPDGADTLVELLDPSPGAANVPPATGHRRFDKDNLAKTGVALAGSGRAEVGGSVTWAVTGGAPAANGLLVVGLLTIVAPTPAKGTLLVDPLLMLPFVTDASGGATIAIPVPNDPALEQLTLYVQGFVSGKGLGNAVATTLGP